MVIDSSPDEKQRIMDYDDDNDKVVVATEVSLSSVAHHGNEVDEITVIESYSNPTEFGDIVSSPLESSEVAGEYVLFSSDVVDYVDSDDSQKTAIKQQMILSEDDKNLHLINIDLPSVEDNKMFQNSSEDETEDNRIKENLMYRDNHTSDHHYASSHDDIMSLPDIIVQKEKVKPVNDSNIATTEDFEAMIDCGNKKTKNSVTSDTKTVISLNSMQPGNTVKSDSKTITIITTQNSAFANRTNPIMSYAARIPISAAMIANRTNVTNLTTHKKLLKDGTQTTAKVSINNQTISVPVLKTVPVLPGNANQNKSVSDNNKMNISKSTPTIINMAQQKITTSSIITLSAYNFTQPRFVQGNSQTTITPVRMSASESLIEKFSPKSSSQSINYTKLSSLTVTQDVSLPTKIFEDESISPDSSIEHDDHDLLSLEKHDMRSEKDATNSESENQIEMSINDNSSTSDKDKNLLPMHVVVKSRESSISPVLTSTSQHQRLATIMPQLSPLSQPTEMTTNMANVSQQLRSIMSSLSSQIKPQVSSGNLHQIDFQNRTTQKSQDNDVAIQNFKLEKTSKSDESSKHQMQQISSGNIQLDKFIAQSKPNTTPQPTSISVSSPTTVAPSSSSSSSSTITTAPSANILLVKQFRPITSSISKQTQVVGHSHNQSIFLTSPQMPNLAKIQPDTKSNIVITSSSGSNIILGSSSTHSSSISHPPALIVTSTNRPGVISMSSNQVKNSGSILSATLSQPSNKFNTLLHTQLSNAPFRRSKSTDEVPISIKSTPAQIMGNKRHSLEASVVKEENSDNGKFFDTFY